MLNEAEINRLLQVAERAVALAEQGQVAQGAGQLQAELRRVQRVKRLGFAGAEELVRRYEYAVARYGERYGLPAATRPNRSRRADTAVAAH